MNTTQRGYSHDDADHRQSDSHGITLGNLMIDLMRVGPAPSRVREVAVIVISLIIFAVLVALVQPEVVITAIVAAVVVVLFVGRWVVGTTRKWGRR